MRRCLQGELTMRPTMAEVVVVLEALTTAAMSIVLSGTPSTAPHQPVSCPPVPPPHAAHPPNPFNSSRTLPFSESDSESEF